MHTCTNSGSYGYFGGGPRIGNQISPGAMGMQYGMMPQQMSQQRGPQISPPDYQSPQFETNIQVLAQASGRMGMLLFT